MMIMMKRYGEVQLSHMKGEGIKIFWSNCATQREWIHFLFLIKQLKMLMYILAGIGIVCVWVNEAKLFKRVSFFT